MGPRKPTHYLVVRTVMFRRKVLEMLAVKRRTPQEMANTIDTTEENARNILLKMRKETPKLVYIAEFTACNGSGRRTPIYALGDLPDMTDRAVPRVKASEKQDHETIHCEVAQSIAKATSRQQTWASALGL